ncbi:hypothetical protein JQ600_35480 [Bradyrhizobium sp. AUGA SZCCT0176]|uniref:hypothetical protein n=1 Tax=Bradyrhizobium sp. AUGA SZCCT0176 TaxID=2807664 RepID=UPI001BA552A8|nr:hypothetical protein [Bradyrhizobium sp. AUGA SZCCT0176]MBR1230199.1 hypothetical protein [Bradyrhizobium sp. AUGA SZCCT0176]
MSLAVYNRTVQDSGGNVVPSAHIEVRREVPGQPLATIYSDRDGTSVLSNPFDAEADGSFSLFAVGGAYRIRAYLGPSGTPTFEAILRYEAIGLSAETDSAADRSKRTVTAAGAVTVASDDVDDIIIEKTVGAATTVNLPDSSLRSKPVRIIDGKGDAATNNITILPISGETIHAIVDYPKIIDQNGGSTTLTPREDGTGWY